MSFRRRVNNQCAIQNLCHPCQPKWPYQSDPIEPRGYARRAPNACAGSYGKEASGPLSHQNWVLGIRSLLCILPASLSSVPGSPLTLGLLSLNDSPVSCMMCPKPGKMNQSSSGPRDLRAFTAPLFAAHLHCAGERAILSDSQLQLGCTA